MSDLISRKESRMREYIAEDLFDECGSLIGVQDHGVLIRCRDCKYCRTYYHGDNMPFSYACDRMYLTNGLSLDDYCSRAERKEA